jgi:hypothetical protein
MRMHENRQELRSESLHETVLSKFFGDGILCNSKSPNLQAAAEPNGYDDFMHSS